MVEAQSHIDATVTQVFHTSNMPHDLFYQYCFTEVASNFQLYNFGKGGGEGDTVIANAQDGSGFNNANFMTPPDRLNGFNTASPSPDQDMESGIVIHELAHGLLTCLTGGPKNSGCLGWGESGGMGEGASPSMQMFTSSPPPSVPPDYAMGAWASNCEGGIRNYVYSVDTVINPSMYKTLDSQGTGTLLPLTPNANGSLPPNYFYQPQTFNSLTGHANPLVPKHSNMLLMQIVLDGMKLQPCAPSFFNARDVRDVIIQTDEILTRVENT
ncbi:hypothetical protein BDN67DRAFT_1045595 [Paxillus ammoniavirescens]|nr:hypothetical protein BDN67DRAFT_1045595 [Paxillus ammoniavirescens]